MCSNAHLNLNSSIIDHDQPDCNLSFSLKQLELSDKYDENDEKTVKLDSPYPPISMREPIRIEKKNKGKEENSKIYPKDYKISSVGSFFRDKLYNCNALLRNFFSRNKFVYSISSQATDHPVSKTLPILEKNQLHTKNNFKNIPKILSTGLKKPQPFILNKQSTKN